MPVYTVSWLFESRAWTKIEANSPEEALEFVKEGLAQYDVDSDETTRKPYKWEVEEGETGAGSVTRIT